MFNIEEITLNSNSSFGTSYIPGTIAQEDIEDELTRLALQGKPFAIRIGDEEGGREFLVVGEHLEKYTEELRSFIELAFPAHELEVKTECKACHLHNKSMSSYCENCGEDLRN